MLCVVTRRRTRASPKLVGQRRKRSDVRAGEPVSPCRSSASRVERAKRRASPGGQNGAYSPGCARRSATEKIPEPAAVPPALREEGEGVRGWAPAADRSRTLG